jgi:DNA-binding GntR family transcriptional regulator
MLLERAGIVAHERNKGARVQAYSPPEVERLYDVREMLTRQATLKITLPVSTEAIAAVQAVQDAFEQAVEKNDLQAIHKTNDAFHIAFFSLCDNPFLVDLLKRSMDMTYVIRAANTSNVKRQAVSCGEHQSMIAMLSGTDSWALSELCVRHLRPSKVAYLERVQAEKVTKKNRRVQ